MRLTGLFWAPSVNERRGTLSQWMTCTVRFNPYSNTSWAMRQQFVAVESYLVHFHLFYNHFTVGARNADTPNWCPISTLHGWLVHRQIKWHSSISDHQWSTIICRPTPGREVQGRGGACWSPVISVETISNVNKSEFLWCLLCNIEIKGIT